MIVVRGRVWKMNIPHKPKIFVWRFCHNNIPFRRRLRAKGVELPIMCPMCNQDIEHLHHLFFDCDLAMLC